MNERRPGVHERRRTASGYDAYAVAMLTLAEANLAIGYGPDSSQLVRPENGETAVETIADIAAHSPWQARREAVLGTVFCGAWLGAKIGFGAVLALLLVWSR